MSATAPLVDRHAPTSIVTWIGAQPLSAAQFCGAARAVAALLPSCGHAVNLCEAMPRFMLWSAAAWLRSQTIVLPPDRLATTLERMKRDFPGAYCVCDTDDVVQAARSLGFAIVRAGDTIDAAAHWPPPGIALDLEAVCLHTSGSTGVPSRHRKSWQELTLGAQTLGRALGTPASNSGVMATVASQHMFGLETAIMFPLQCGARLLPVRPALPADLVDAMRVAASLGIDSAWLFTTPLQLRAFHAAHKVDGIERVVTATMPLDVALARSVERDWGAVVEEIYGCTEGGTLAFRRPTQGDVFTAGPGIEFAIDANGRAMAAGGHVLRPVPLGDRIELVDATSSVSQKMRFVGRDDDLVKVAGKRASLAGLTATLKSLPGVEDAAFFFPSDDATRLCAVVVAPSTTSSELSRELASVVDPAFLPRPLVFVDAIPRSAAYKVSLPMLRELIASRASARPVTSDFAFQTRFALADPVFAGHFPGRPIVPGVLLVERVEAALAARGCRLLEVTSVKFHAAAAPDETLDVRVASAGEGTMRFEVARDATVVAAGECRVAEITVP